MVQSLPYQAIRLAKVSNLGCTAVEQVVLDFTVDVSFVRP
jgi:hypothetical protein